MDMEDVMSFIGLSCESGAYPEYVDINLGYTHSLRGTNIFSDINFCHCRD